MDNGLVKGCNLLTTTYVDVVLFSGSPQSESFPVKSAHFVDRFSSNLGEVHHLRQHTHTHTHPEYVNPKQTYI